MNHTREIKTSNGEPEKLQKKFKPVSPLLFYILIIISAGFIWMAPKF
jgi:hypothetical protein